MLITLYLDEKNMPVCFSTERKLERPLIELRVPAKLFINSLCAGEKVNKEIRDCSYF